MALILTYVHVLLQIYMVAALDYNIILQVHCNNYTNLLPPFTYPVVVLFMLML